MKKKLYQYSLYVLAFSLCFLEDWSSKALILTSILSLFNIRKNKSGLKKPFFRILLFMFLYVILNMAFIAQTWNSNIYSILGLLSLFFFLHNYTQIDETTYGKIPLAFALGVFIVGIINVFPFLLENSLDNFRTLFNSWNTYAIIDVHKIYYALFLCLSYVLVIEHLRHRQIKYNYVYICFSFLFCFIMLYYTGSANGFLLFLIGHLFLIVSYLRPKIRSILSIGFLTLPFILLFVLAMPKAQETFSKIDGESSRMRNYNINKELFLEAPFFGHGIGKERETMQAKRNPRSWEYKNNYNAHNQYFESVIGGGLVLVLITLLFFVLLIIQSTLNKFNFAALCFSAFMLFSFLIESVLRRHHGIFFFSFFLVYFLFRVKKKNNEY